MRVVSTEIRPPHTIITRDRSQARAKGRSRTIRLNTDAAQQYQHSVLGQRQGPYDVNTNSCVTHVLNVLQAGGVNVPPEAFVDVNAGEAFLRTFRDTQ